MRCGQPVDVSLDRKPVSVGICRQTWGSPDAFFVPWRKRVDNSFQVLKAVRELRSSGWKYRANKSVRKSTWLDQSGGRFGSNLTGIRSICYLASIDMAQAVKSETSTMDTTCLAKKERVLARLGGDENLLQEIVQVYFEDYPALLLQADLAIANHCSTSLIQAAHDLKGLLSNFSSSKVTAAVQALEQTGKLNQMENSPTRLKVLCGELEILSSELKKWTNRS